MQQKFELEAFEQFDQRRRSAFRLLTNNPKKIEDLTNYGLQGITQEKHVSGVGEWNKRYLRAKKEWGHRLDDEDIGG